MEPHSKNIEVDDALKLRIDQLAQTSGMTPAQLIREAVEEFVAKRNGHEPQGSSDSLWDAAARISESVPESEWAKLPADLAKNFDHYHYGHPRVE